MKVDEISKIYNNTSPNPLTNLLHELPFLIPFSKRLELFSKYYKTEREKNRVF